MKKIVLFLAALFGGAALFAGEVTVKPENAQIVLSKECGGVAEFAAKDLQHYLKMITGKVIPLVETPVKGKFTFLFTQPAGMKPEEGRYEVTKNGVTFAGDDQKLRRNFRDAWDCRRTGSISAVVNFLERQLKVRWMEPGDDGVFYIPAQELKLSTEKCSWDPGRLVDRGIRADYARWAYRGSKQNASGMPDELQYNRKDYMVKSALNRLWMKHHRMGGSVYVPFGHAFTQWWKKYGKEHPEYFALFKGKRAPARPKMPETIKMCPSCEGFQDKIVEEWAAKKPRPAYINVCENDWGDYCECANCRKLDVTPKGEKWEDHLSDRYFYFANQVLAKARKIDPKVKVCLYAYATYVEPPAKVKVDSGIVIGFVPSMHNLEKTAQMYKGWRKMGADMMVLRPNDHHCNCGLPMGLEEQIWKGFQLGYKNGMIGTDYDSCHGFWAATGLADYILARAHNYPNASFEELFDHYCEGYGAAAQEVKEYYNYWRKNFWNKRLVPNRKKLAEIGRYGDFRRGLMWRLPEYYKDSDFAITVKMLEKAMNKAKTSVEKKRIAWLQLCHKHAYMTYKAICAPAEKKMPLAQELLKFRLDNREKLNINLLRQSTIEIQNGDLTGISKAGKFKGMLDVRVIPVRWYFDPDPQKIGLKEGWQTWDWEKYKGIWAPIYVDNPWENQSQYDVPEGMKKFLKKYDGIGWYAQSIKIPANWKRKKIGLFFGAVDEAALIFLNGKQIYNREFKHPDDWKTSFTVPITDHIDWSKKEQLVTVRVEDNSGAGGIWQPVYLVQMP